MVTKINGGRNTFTNKRGKEKNEYRTKYSEICKYYNL